MEFFKAIGFEKLLPKEKKEIASEHTSDNQQSHQNSDANKGTNESGSKQELKEETSTLGEKNVAITCTVSLKSETNGALNDDVIFVKECKGTVVHFEVKIGSTSDLPINITGDNSGINSSNPIVID